MTIRERLQQQRMLTYPRLANDCGISPYDTRLLNTPRWNKNVDATGWAIYNQTLAITGTRMVSCVVSDRMQYPLPLREMLEKNWWNNESRLHI